MKMFVAGRWVESSKLSSVVAPYSGDEIDTVPEATEEQVQEALCAGVQGAAAMAKLPASERSRILEKTAQLIENQVEDLARTCAPALRLLLDEKDKGQLVLPFEKVEEAAPPTGIDEFIAVEDLAELPQNTASRITQAVQLLRHYENKKDLLLSPVFTPLQGPLDNYCKDIVFNLLVDEIPRKEADQKDYFEPYITGGRKSHVKYLLDNAKRIQKLIVYNAAIMPISILTFCLEYAETQKDEIGGVFETIRRNSEELKGSGLLQRLSEVYDFRNTYVAHQKQELKDIEETRIALKKWVSVLIELHAIAVRVAPK